VSMCVSKHNSNEHAERSYEKVRRPSYFAKATVSLYALKANETKLRHFQDGINSQTQFVHSFGVSDL